MGDVQQKRIWAYAELPIPLESVGDMSSWRVIGGDPIALLEEAIAFIGWPGCPDGLKERIYEVLAPFAEEASS